MKHFTTLNIFWALFALVQALSLHAQQSGDQTLSPYFLVISEEETLDVMPLKSTKTSVAIAGNIAHVEMVQTYENEGTKPLEAIYVFPGSSRAAMHQMRLKIGDREIIAEVAEREAAQKAYETAKAAGYTASLLSQERPNVFQMNVANILPGDHVTVSLAYSEMLVPEQGVYEFIYPTLVAPRYFNTETLQAAIGGKDAWILNPYLQDGSAPNYSFDIQTNIQAGMALKEVSCPSHKVAIVFSEDASEAQLALAGSDFGGNRDYVVRYQLAGDEISSGLLLYEGAEENFFLATIQPPKAVSPKQSPPREYIFVVDVSGSMHGLPLGIVESVISEVTATFKPEDRFNLLLFSSSDVKMADAPVAATQDNIALALSLLHGSSGRGDTELLPALSSAFAIPPTPGYSRSFIVVTDGYITIEQEVFEMIRNGLSEANLFAIGIGQDVNRFLVEGMAYAGMGEPLIVTDRGDAKEQARRFVDYINRPVLTDISVDLEGFEVYDLIPKAVPDLMAERPITLMGKYKGKPSGKIRLKGQLGNEQTFQHSISVAAAVPSEENQALRYLWAREQVKILDDYQEANQSEASKKAVTELGLKYHLLTKYTSFVAIDTEARGQGDNTTVKQALPIPSGMQQRGAGTSARPATDASRSLAGAAKLRVVLPKSTPVTADLAQINWHLSWASPVVEADVAFVFTAKDLYGKVLHSEETSATVLTLDMAEEPYASAKSVVMYEVQVKDMPDVKSETRVLKKTKLSDADLAQVSELKADGSEEALRKLAAFFDGKKMYAHALAVYDRLLKLADSPRNRYTYDMFLSRNSLKE